MRNARIIDTRRVCLMLRTIDHVESTCKTTFTRSLLAARRLFVLSMNGCDIRKAPQDVLFKKAVYTVQGAILTKLEAFLIKNFLELCHTRREKEVNETFKCVLE